MTLLTVVQDVCAMVGVERPTSVFSNINNNRTMQEMLALANEVATRIAYDSGHDWTALRTSITLTGDGVTIGFELPANYKRMLLTSEVYRLPNAARPMRFIPDLNDWLLRRYQGYSDPRGEWIINGITGGPGQAMSIWPVMAGPITATAWAKSHSYSVNETALDEEQNTIWKVVTAHTSASSGLFATDRAARPGLWAFADNAAAAVSAVFACLDNRCIIPAAGGLAEAFAADGDRTRLDQRLLKLGLVWQWKALKGSPYAEDLATYNDAMALAIGKDNPAPILIGRLPISAAARVGYPFPIDPGMVPL